MWTCGDKPVDAHAAWPLPIVETITTAFTDPGAHVVLVGIDTATRPGADGAKAIADASVAAARKAVHALDRTAETLALDPRTSVPDASLRPFWADLVTESADPSATLAGTPPRTGAPNSANVLESGGAARADLLLVSLPAGAAETVPLDRLALLAADRLRRGGIFAVYTHSDWSRGKLVDPTGAVVAAAQHADLLYLQHIVALHTPVAKGRLHAAPSAAMVAEHDRTRHRATMRGLPAPHLRAHGDVLAFAQPTDLAAPLPQTTTATAALGTRQTSNPSGNDPTDPATTTGVTDAAELPLSVWATAQTSPAAQRKGRYTTDSTAHPAKMLPAVAAHAIRAYTRPGELVFDPMAGSGTTLVEAIDAGRRAVGVEYEPHWVSVARANLDLARQRGHDHDGEVLHGDARQLPFLLPEKYRERVALVVTSPPYGPSTHGQVVTANTKSPDGKVHKYHHLYGNTLDRGNLANVGHHRLLAGFTRVLTGCAGVLRPGGHVAITVRPWREHSELIDLPSQIIACGKAAGLVPVERCVALLARVADRDLVTRGSFFQRDFIRKQREQGLPLHLISHEDVVVLRRPLTSSSSEKPKHHQAEPECSSRPAAGLDAEVRTKFDGVSQ